MEGTPGHISKEMDDKAHWLCSWTIFYTGNLKAAIVLPDLEQIALPPSLFLKTRIIESDLTEC